VGNIRLLISISAIVAMNREEKSFAIASEILFIYASTLGIP